MTALRIYCSVTGCHHYTRRATAMRRFGSDLVRIICGKHWSNLTKDERRVWSRIGRQTNKFGVDNLGDRQHRVFNALIRRAGRKS